MRKIILITGASSGLGAGMAREFAARGRDLVLCARRTERLTPIRVSTIHPGYIRTELNESAPHMPFEIDAATGARLLARVIEKEPATACVPAWPWTVFGFVMRRLPLSLIARMA